MTRSIYGVCYSSTPFGSGRLNGVSPFQPVIHAVESAVEREVEDGSPSTPLKSAIIYVRFYDSRPTPTPTHTFRLWPIFAVKCFWDLHQRRTEETDGSCRPRKKI